MRILGSDLLGYNQNVTKDKTEKSGNEVRDFKTLKNNLKIINFVNMHYQSRSQLQCRALQGSCRADDCRASSCVIKTSIAPNVFCFCFCFLLLVSFCSFCSFSFFLFICLFSFLAVQLFCFFVSFISFFLFFFMCLGLFQVFWQLFSDVLLQLHQNINKCLKLSCTLAIRKAESQKITGLSPAWTCGS